MPWPTREANNHTASGPRHVGEPALTVAPETPSGTQVPGPISCPSVAAHRLGLLLSPPCCSPPAGLVFRRVVQQPLSQAYLSSQTDSKRGLL